MIVEFSPSGGFGVLAPAINTPFSGSIGYDLNADYGAGQNARKIPILSQSGEEVLMVVRVTAAFTIGAGAPVAQFHAVLSQAATPSIFAVPGLANHVIIGTNAGPDNNIATTRFHPGYLAAELTLNKTFFIRFNPWTTSMGRATTGGAIKVGDLRYLGLAIFVPNNETGAYFSAGTVVGNLVKASDILQTPSDFAYPSAVSHVG